jgi:DNA-directed RNA polymerase subunit RPC12/RpoP
VLQWLTTDRFACLDCHAITLTPSRWLDGTSAIRCKACGSVSLVRRQGLARGFRDLIVLTNAA